MVTRITALVGALGLALAGCHLPFGLERLEKDKGAEVTGRLHYLYATNDSSFKPTVVEDVLPVADVNLEVTREDGTRLFATYREDGTFSFPIAYEGQAYRLKHTLGVNAPSELSLSAPHLEMNYTRAGRPGMRPVQLSRINFPYSIDAGASVAHVASTGVFTYTSTAMKLANVSFDWRLAAAAGGAELGMLDASEYDRVYAFENETVSGFGSPATFTRVRAVSSDAVTQSYNSTATLAKPVPTAPNFCFRATFGAAEQARRIQEVTGRTYTTMTADWLAYSVPSMERTAMIGALLLSQSAINPVQDFTIAPPLLDPFGGQQVVSAAAHGNFTVLLPGSTTPVALRDSIRLHSKIEPLDPVSCAGTETSLAVSIGIAGRLVIDDQPLDGDFQSIVVDPTRDVVFRWEQPIAGDATGYAVTIYELLDLDGVTAYVLRSSGSTAGELTMMHDSSVFEPGHTYIGVVTTSGNFPGSVAGDYYTLAPMFQGAQIWTRPFVAVAPPAE